MRRAGSWKGTIDGGIGGGSTAPTCGPDTGPVFRDFAIGSNGTTWCPPAGARIETDGGCAMAIHFSCYGSGFDPPRTAQTWNVTFDVDAGTFAGSWALTTHKFRSSDAPTCQSSTTDGARASDGADYIPGMEHAGLDARGRLTPGGKLRALAQSMVMRWRAGPPRGQPVRACPALPAGAIAKRALAWSADASPPWLHAHVLRTYCWGTLLGEAGGLKPDDELLFTACALHDLGLTQLYAPEPGECFAFAGARSARMLLAAEGVPAVWAERVAVAIELHLEVHVALEQGVEAKLLREGAALDVLAVGGKRLASETRRNVLKAYSREGFGPKIAEAVLAAGKNAPGTRADFYCKVGNFAGRAARARLPEEGSP